MNRYRKHKWLYSLLMLLLTQPIFAQTETTEAVSTSGLDNNSILIGALTATFLTLLLVFAVLAGVTVSLISGTSVASEEQEEKEPFWTWFYLKFNSAVPKSKEQDIMLDHSYDGIRELDNDLPPWWKYGFYFTIVFAVIYLFIYHGGGEQHAVSVREYMAETQEAEERKLAYLAKMESLIDENSVVALSESMDIEVGKDIYMNNCRACHGGAGEGGVGPNLTDAYWLHGGGVQNIFKTIKYGVQEKGMLSWKEKLTPKQMQQVSSFILTLEGTNPPNGKEPQGELYEAEEGEKKAEETDKPDEEVAVVK